MRFFLADGTVLPQAWSSDTELRGQFETETGEFATDEFGAYMTQPFGSDLLIGLSNNPGNYDGALITRSADGNTFTTEHVLDEQGVHDLQIVSGRVFVPGTDPAFADDWTLGNLYECSIGGAWTKRRTLPLTIHALGLWHDGSMLWVCGGMHTGDNETWVGRVLRSIDDGVTWAAQVDVTDYRAYDVIGHAGRLYATGYTAALAQKLYSSQDNGATWAEVIGVTPAIKPRMIAFGTNLLVAGSALSSTIYRIDNVHAVTTLVLPFTVASWWNVLATDGTHVYALASDGYVWRSGDLTNWTRYTYVANAIAVQWWSGVGLMVADVGLNARIWQA